MAALLRACQLPAVRCQPLGQLGRRLLHHHHSTPGPARVPSAARAASPAVFRVPCRRVAAAAGGGVATRGTEEVNQGILELYDDESTSAWERMWGTHMHQGFYDPGVTPDPADNRSAVLRTLEEAVGFAGISDPAKRPKRILDVGCGIGGGTVYLTKRLGSECHGINISPSQIERCRALAAAEGVTDRVTFHVGDATEQPFPDGHFDLVWCMEAAEHMPDKKKFFSELVRVAAPGGTIVLSALCHRDADAVPLTPEEEVTLKRLCEALHHGSWYSVAGYLKLAKSFALEDIKTANWSENVLPFWPGVVQAAMTPVGSEMVLHGGPEVLKFVLTAPAMADAYRNKLINYTIITCRKPHGKK